MRVIVDNSFFGEGCEDPMPLFNKRIQICVENIEPEWRIDKYVVN